MNDDTTKLKQQHFNSYKRSVKDIIENNSYLLVKEDLSSLIKKPPLDSMDIIKNKFLNIAKKNKLKVNSEILEDILNKYRNNILNDLDNIIDDRTKYYQKIVDKYKIDDSIKILKKDINIYNKEVKKKIKNILIKAIKIIDINKIIDNLEDKDIKEINKYLNDTYIKDILENVDIKILVKDATMINSIKEATDTYLFTLSNSRLFD